MEATIASTLDEKLNLRGLLTVAKLSGWHESKHKNIVGWEYPVYNPFTGAVIGTRFKAAEKTGGAKYLWLPSKPQDPLAEWYTMPTAKAAIAAADGVAYLGNGEPALLAYHAAQVYNTIATTLSEVAVPKGIVNYLQSLGITRLLYPIDNDEAGRKSAINWRDALRGSGIDFVAFSWGDDAPKKADANDIWIQLAFDAQAFQARLKTLSAIELPAPKAPLPKPELGSFEQTPRGLIDAVANALGITAFKANGWSKKNVSSPFREDKEPSAGFNQISGVLHDFGTEDSYGVKAVAERLGIDWKPYYPQSGRIVKTAIDTKPKAPKKAAKPRKPAAVPMVVGIEEKPDESLSELPYYPGAYYSWIDQKDLPVAWVSALLNLSDGKSAVAGLAIKMHEAFRTGRLNARAFTIKDVVQTLDTPRKSTTAAIESLFQWGFVSILETIINTMYTPSASEQKSAITGRPAKMYSINRDSKSIGFLLAEMMDYCVTEAIGRNSLVPATHTMISDLTAQNLEISEAKAWSERTESVSRYTKIKLETELAMWSKALLQDESNKSYRFKADEIESSRDVRVQLLRAFLAGHEGGGVQISNERLAWMLGCNESNLKAIYGDAIVFSERRFSEYEPELEDIRNSDYDKLIRDAGQKAGGLPIAMLIKRISDNKWTGYHFSEAAMFDLFRREQGNIARLKIRVEQPSFVRLGRLKSGYFSRLFAAWLMLAYTLKCLIELELDLEEKEAETDKEEIEKIEAEASEIAATLPKKPAKPRLKNAVERDWRSHNHEFMREQLRIGAHVFTEGGLLPEDLSLVDAVRYLNANSLKNPVRTIQSYFAEDDISTLLGTLSLLGGERRNGIHPKIAKPATDVKPVIKDFPDYPLDPHSGEPYHDYLNNPYLTPKQREERLKDVERWKAQDAERERQKAQQEKPAA